MKKLIIILAALLLLTGCGKNTGYVPADDPDTQETEDTMYGKPVATPQYALGRELMCLAGSEEQANEIAELYGIELVSFSSPVAVFHTEDDPYKVIERGKTEGWPELSVNGVSKAH